MNQELINNLIELRKRILYIIIGIVITFLGLFRFANQIYNLVSKPLLDASNLSGKLIATEVTAPFLIPVKITIISAIFISLPNTIYQIWKFLAPAMYKNEKRILLIATIYSVILFTLGILFCYFLVLPTFFKFIGNFKAPTIEIMTDITKYYDFVINLFMIFGVAFLTPILVMLLIYFNIIGYSKFKQIRPYIFVGVFIIAAIVTPPDVLSQTLLAIPLYILYEIGLILGKIIKK